MPSIRHPLIIALDLGTSSVRALLYDAQGRIQPGREVQIKYQQHLTGDGGVEFDADKLVAHTLKALKSLLRLCSAEELGRIAAVATSCFWHALVGVDKNGGAVTPIYSWADTRSKEEVERLITGGLDAAAYHRRTGCFVHSSYWPAKIAWLRSSEPSVVDKISLWLSFSDYLMLKVSGAAKTSLSIASATGLFNQQSGDWDDETLEMIGVPKERLPQIAAQDETFAASKSVGLPELDGIPWYPAYGDGACSNIGAGGVDTTRIVVNISTSGAIRVLTGPPRANVPEGLFQYRMDQDRWIIGGAVSNGGNAYAWLNESLRLPDRSRLEGELLRARPDSHGLTVLPFWAGERSPGWHAVASAAMVGLNLSTTPLEISQASMEAIGYSLRTLREDLLKTFPSATQVIVSGGAVEHSRYMPQLLASVFDSPVRRSLDPEPSGRGAALAVSERLGLLKSVGNSPDRLSRPILPDKSAAAAYAGGYSRFLTFYEMMMGKRLEQPVAKTEDTLRNV